MPPSVRIKKEDIVAEAVSLVRQKGMDSLNARELAARLHCSTQPIFSNFAAMEELEAVVMEEAYRYYVEYIARGMQDTAYPPYKASGMAYIRFAREEHHLFHLLFMRDRSGEEIRENREEIAPLITLIAKNNGFTEEEAYRLHLEMWLFVHGIAAMIATSYLVWDEDTVSGMLTDEYLGLTARFRQRRDNAGADGILPSEGK